MLCKKLKTALRKVVATRSTAGLGTLSAKGKQVAKGANRDVGFMSRKDLQDKLPDLFKAYVSIYGSGRPDIKIVATDTFNFPDEEYSMGSWHEIFVFYTGQVKKIPVQPYFGKAEKIKPGSMFLDCMTGNLDYCKLYINPEDAAPLLKEAEALTDSENIALHVMSSYKSFAREDEFLEIICKGQDWRQKDQRRGEYTDALKSLAAKGLVKISAAGSAQLTLEGKNRAIEASSSVRKKYGVY